MPWRSSEDGRAGVKRWLLAGGGLALVAAAIAFGVLWATGVFDDDPVLTPAKVAEVAREGGSGDPFAYSDSRRTEFEQRAASGYSHVLYEKSPGGIVASAKRTAVWRDEIERAARDHGADPDLMEAMVLLESAGRPEVIAGVDPEAASGLAQIVASTGIDLLGMRVDLARSQAITRQLFANEAELVKRRAQAQGSERKQRIEAVRRVGELERENVALRRERVRVDERFDPVAALDGMGRYLEIAEERFGRTDLAVASYHMGIGNLESVIARYAGTEGQPTPVGETVAAGDLDYARLLFDSSPLENARAWNLLGAFGDDSSTYLWRVLAAERIMRMYRDERRALVEMAELHAAKATAEEVFHPQAETEAFADPAAIEAELEDADLVPIPDGREYGYVIGDQLGQLARRLEVDPRLYRTLRPEALATLVYMTARVRKISGGEGTLIVTSATRDQQYQDELLGSNPEATPAYSLHTTGYSFDVLRKYRNDRQASAFQFMLDRLRALSVIDYAVEPAAIHITVSDQARPLLGG